MTTPISSSNVVPPVSSTTGSAPNSTSAGLSSVASSLASATDQGFCGQISACIANVFDTIRGCLARLPYIGYWFESTPVTTIVPPVSISSSTLTWTDAERAQMIRNMLPPAAGIPSGAPVPAVPQPDVVNHLLQLFREINSPACKIQAFQTVLEACCSTDDMARQFYDALPEGTGAASEASRSAFRRHAWLANGSSSVYNGHDHEAGFGDHIVYHAIRSPTAQQAARNLHAALLPPVSSSGAP